MGDPRLLEVSTAVGDVPSNPRYPDVEPVPATVLVNPRIEILSQAVEQGWEGCLSVPGLRGRGSVRRHDAGDFL